MPQVQISDYFPCRFVGALNVPEARC